MADCFESNMSRKEVLALYRRLLQTSKTWLAYSGLEIDTKAEQEYIRSETVRLFRKNKDLRNSQEIELALKEGEARLELALHYRNPYPRPVNVPPLALPQMLGKRLGKGQLRVRKQAKPVYIQSHDEYDQS